MSHFEGVISDFAQGDAFEQPCTVDVTDILPDVLSKAWFTVKRSILDSDVDAIFQKVITAVLSDDGQIDEVGSVTDEGHLIFLVTAANTNSLAAGVRYYYDIKALSSSGAAKVLEEGRIYCRASVTRATS